MAEVKNGIIIDNVIYEAVDFNGEDYDSMWLTSCALCGWDSQIYEIVEEPIYDKGVQWGTERIVKRREV